MSFNWLNKNKSLKIGRWVKYKIYFNLDFYLGSGILIEGEELIWWSVIEVFRVVNFIRF